MSFAKLYWRDHTKRVKPVNIHNSNPLATHMASLLFTHHRITLCTPAKIASAHILGGKKC